MNKTNERVWTTYDKWDTMYLEDATKQLGEVYRSRVNKGFLATVYLEDGTKSQTFMRAEAARAWVEENI